MNGVLLFVGPSNPRIHLSPWATHARANSDPPGRSLNCTPPDDTIQPPLISPVSSMTAKERREGGLGTPTTTTFRSNPTQPTLWRSRRGMDLNNSGPWPMLPMPETGLCSLGKILEESAPFVQYDIAGR